MTTVIRINRSNMHTGPYGVAPAHYVYIGRPSKWGNPFAIGRDGDRNAVVAKYAVWIAQQPELLQAIPELVDKVLGCWCAPQACHGDVLAALANAHAAQVR